MHLRNLGMLLLLTGWILAQSDPGTYDDATHLYRNRTYAFTCKVPAGWVLRTEQLKPDNAADKQVLLAAFERPPEAPGPPASTILIAAEPQSSYPTLKIAQDYFAPLDEVITARGFKAVNDPYAFPVGAAQLIRQDFSHEPATPAKDRPTMYQSTLVLLSHSAILSFTFIAASEDDVDTLLENLSFTTTPHSAPKSTAKAASKRKPNTP